MYISDKNLKIIQAELFSPPVPKYPYPFKNLALQPSKYPSPKWKWIFFHAKFFQMENYETGIGLLI